MSLDKVALYWDFENIHASVLDMQRGAGAYARTGNLTQDAVVNIDAIMEYAALFGRIVINRAYADWSRFVKYRQGLLLHAVDLVQTFNVSGTKNGADIRLALDALQDLMEHDSVSHVVVVAGDSDFIPLGQRARRLGRYVVGVSAQSAAAKYWVSSCDEFKYYSNLTGHSGVLLQEGEDLEGLRATARDLLVRAVRQLAAGSREPGWAYKAAIHPMLKRLDPSFDLTRLGYRDLDAFLLDQDEMLERRTGDHDHLYRLRVPENEVGHSAYVVHGTISDDAQRYQQILHDVDVKLIDPTLLAVGISRAVTLAGTPTSNEGFAAFLGEAYEHPRAHRDARTLRGLLWQVEALRTIDLQSGTIELTTESEMEIWTALVDLVCKHLEDEGEPVQATTIHELLVTADAPASLAAVIQARASR
jgi:hypothetical protein